MTHFNHGPCLHRRLMSVAAATSMLLYVGLPGRVSAAEAPDPADVPAAAVSSAAPAAVSSVNPTPAPAALQQPSTSPTDPTPQTAAAAAQPKQTGKKISTDSGHFWNLQADPKAYSIVGAGSGLSLYKPMYLQPATYSPQYTGRHTEAVFQISLKLKLFSFPKDGALYAAYTQKSFFDAYDKKDSSPFRETDYNPEAFYRYIPSDAEKWHHMGIDVGFEHNSNGQRLPDSRSWNRIYIAPFQAEADHLIYYKIWWRLPENENRPRTDPRRDDNPDIQDYYGYSELHIEKQFGDEQLVHLMLRANPGTRRGAIELQYSIPGPGKRFFWGLFLFSGYGDSLIDYNHSVTRLGLGILFAR